MGITRTEMSARAQIPRLWMLSLFVALAFLAGCTPKDSVRSAETEGTKPGAVAAKRTSISDSNRESSADSYSDSESARFSAIDSDSESVADSSLVRSAASLVRSEVESSLRSSEDGRASVAASESASEATTAAAPAQSVKEPSGRTLTPSQEQAAGSARSYLSYSGFSRRGLIAQLSSEFADKYSLEDATAAVDSLTVDWNAEAVQSAESYLKFGNFSCRGLIDQLSSEFADHYTVDQATFAANQVGIC